MQWYNSENAITPSLRHPDLDALLKKATVAKRRRAGWKAAIWATSRAKLRHPAIASVLLGGATKELVGLGEGLDEAYFELAESDAAKLKVLTAFGKARAVSALVFAVKGEAGEAVYEAAFCADHIAESQKVLLAELR